MLFYFGIFCFFFCLRGLLIVGGFFWCVGKALNRGPGNCCVLSIPGARQPQRRGCQHCAVLSSPLLLRKERYVVLLE